MCIFQSGKPCLQEIRYIATSDQALAGFATLYNEQITVHKMKQVDGETMRNVGSRKLQQVIISSSLFLQSSRN